MKTTSIHHNCARSVLVGFWATILISGLASIGGVHLEVFADETTNSVDYCSDFSAFADRFERPPFPENASADEQKNWYALKKTCGRDLIKLSTIKWPSFDAKPNDVDDELWKKFIAQEELSRFTIGESIFDENHGGTLIKKYYFTDYEPDKIIAL